MQKLQIIKSVDKDRESDYPCYVDRLQKRYQSAAGQQQSVIGELFAYVRQTTERQKVLESRLAVLENK